MKTTTIELDHGTTKIQTKAYVFGEWAAHRVPEHEGTGWRVSHVPSGHAVHGGCGWPVAVRVAKALDEAVPELQLVEVAIRAVTEPRWRFKNASDGKRIRATIETASRPVRPSVAIRADLKERPKERCKQDGVSMGQRLDKLLADLPEVTK